MKNVFPAVKKLWLMSLLLFSIWLPSGARAFDSAKPFSQYKQIVWNTENGLPQNLVLAMTQTRDGYLWFGTQEGLARFNGAAFKVFDTITSPALKSSHINALREDRAGRLWVGTLKGLYCYENGEFTAYTTENGLPRNYISALYEDRNGDLWIGTGGGVSRLRDNQIVSYGAPEGLTGERVRAIGEDGEGNLWIGTADGLFRLRDNEFKQFKIDDGSPNGNAVRAIHLDARKALWIGTENGLLELKDEKFVANAKFTGKVIRTIAEDKQNQLWAGGDFGINRADAEQTGMIESAKGMPAGGTYSMLFDTEGDLWFSTEGDGLRQFVDAKFSVYAAAENMSGDIAFAIAQNAAGDVWVSTDKGVSRFRQNAFDLNLFKQKELPSDRIVTILSDGAKDLWIGTTNGLLRRQNNRLVDIRGGEELRKKLVQALYRDQENNLWIGTNSGLYRFDEKSNGGELIGYKQIEQLANANIYAVAGSLSRGLWLGTSKGLLLFKNNGVSTFTTANNLANDAVVSLYEDAAGVLWIGTYSGGLSRFKNNQFASVTTRDGLFNQTVFSIVPDDAGNLWMSCNRGIFSVSKQSLDEFFGGQRKTIESAVYGMADGMRTFECNGGFQPAALKAHDGKLWFPTVKGAAVVDPTQLRQNSLPPPVHLEGIVADSEPMPPGESANLPAGTRRLEFHFAALSFIAPEKVRYRYRLDGYDSDWIEAGNRREAFYTNLPHGDYRFRVTASNNDGVWNEKGAELALRINPYFYQTWWFVLVCAASAGGILAALHFWRVQQLQLRHAAVLAERTRIARELHDTLLQGFVGVSSQLGAVAQQFSNQPQIAEKHLAVARKMIRHSVTEARRSVQNLRADESAAADLSQALRETANRILSQQSALRFDFQIHGTPFEIPIESAHHLLRIAEEATANVVKHAAAKNLQIALRYNRPSVRLEIVDDGRGFRIENAFSAVNGHFGLLGMNERAEKANGNLTIETVAPHGTKIVFEINSALARSTKTAQLVRLIKKDSAEV